MRRRCRGPEGRKLLYGLAHHHHSPILVMDRAYQDNQTRQPASALGFTLVTFP